MIFSCRLNHLLLPTAYVCVALLVGPFVHSQATPAAQKVKTVELTPQVVFQYDFLIQIIGEEDMTIHSKLLNTNGNVMLRRDYATEIGINKGEEQTMIEIAVDAYRQGVGEMSNPEFDHWVTCYKLIGQYGTDEGQRLCDKKPIPPRSKNNPALEIAVKKMKAELGDEAFAKITKYLTDGGLDGSYAEGIKAVDRADLPDPCPPNNHPPPGQTTHRACAETYAFDIFEGAALINNDILKLAATSESETVGGTPARLLFLGDIPDERAEAATAVSREAYRAIEENQKECNKEIEKNVAQHVLKYGPDKGIEMPADPEVDALCDKKETIIEEYIYKLRQEVGDDFFNALDNQLSKKNNWTIPVESLYPHPQQSPRARP